MLGMKFLVLLLLWTLALAQDNKDFESQLEEDPMEDTSFETRREVDRHVIRLNATEIHVVEIAITNTTQEIKRIVAEALELGCSTPSQMNSTLHHTMPAADSNKSDLDSCSALRTELLELKLRKNVFTGIKLVDDEIKSKEILYLSQATKKKRSLERKVQLTTLTKELKMGAKLLGKDTTEGELRQKKKRASIPCSYHSFSSRFSGIARRLGKTIQVSAGGEVGVLFSATADIAYTYGPMGEFGCATSVCTGWKFNLGISVGITTGYYYNFDDVGGKSKVLIFSAKILGVVGGSFGLITTANGKKIGYLTGVSFGLALLPVHTLALTCDTTMTRLDTTMTRPDTTMTTPDTTITTSGCSKTRVSFKDKYYTKCGFKYRTSYKYRYDC